MRVILREITGRKLPTALARSDGYPCRRKEHDEYVQNRKYELCTLLSMIDSFKIVNEVRSNAVVASAMVITWKIFVVTGCKLAKRVEKMGSTVITVVRRACCSVKLDSSSGVSPRSTFAAASAAASSLVFPSGSNPICWRLWMFYSSNQKILQNRLTINTCLLRKLFYDKAWIPLLGCRQQKIQPKYRRLRCTRPVFRGTTLFMVICKKWRR